MNLKMIKKMSLLPLAGIICFAMNSGVRVWGDVMKGLAPPTEIPLLNHSVNTVFFQEAEKIDIEKLNPRRILLDQNSFMAQPHSFYYFHNMDKLNFQLDWVKRGDHIFPLKEPVGKLTADYISRRKQHSLEEYFERSSVLGFLVLHDNRIVLEKYFHGANSNSRFLSNSVAKSFHSVLVGVAIQEGKIQSVNDLAEKYLPSLANSGFRGVTIKNLLQMTSNVQWDEEYLKPEADIHRYAVALLRGEPSFKSLVASIKPGGKAGAEFKYQSINSQLIGWLLEEATGLPLNKYAEEKLWRPLGAESDAYYYRGKKQPEIAAAGNLNVTLRDYGRFGLMAMNGGVLGQRRIVRESWIRESSTPDADFLKPKPPGPDDAAAAGLGYGYQWWLPYGSDRAFVAMGIYGQAIYVNPRRHIVIVQSSAWREPDPNDGWDEMIKVMGAISHKIPLQR
jgi:CubicO group peptidase (beta-lactamase class C family)